MKPKWAAEPWKSVEGKLFIKKEEGWGSIVNDQDWFIAKLEDTSDPEANADRIVASVNACTGLNPAAIPDAVALLERVSEWLSKASAGGPDATTAVDIRNQTASVLSQLRNLPI